MKYAYLIFLILFCIKNTIAQSSVTNVIVNLSNGSIQAFINELSSTERQINYKVLSKDLDIIMMESSEAICKYIELSPFVESWGTDHEIDLRGTPNDTRFNDQWSHRLIKSEKAWDINTGNKFDSQHDIVIAILDEGIDISHPELLDNSYVNTLEIPQNGIDDDSNGYIDDYFGLNIKSLNDQHTVHKHGTAVAGIIGAKGNNNEGITGVMWNTKMLYFSEVTRQSELIEVFQYIINLRRKWNETKGAEGALIVATNYSAGIDNVFGSDPEYKSWCDMYDLLGEVGILNTGATTNSNTNVDLEGDMPTTCPSDYLISVTSVGSDDRKINGAGYGAEHIDLGAPGGTSSDPLLVLGLNGNYTSFNGTSGATPQVAGAIGLLYGVNCLEFQNEVYNSPSVAAIRVKNAILNGTDTNSSLEGITVSNGRLNLNKALEHLIESCETNHTNHITSISYDNQNFHLSYTQLTGESPEISITDVAGRIMYSESVSLLDPNSTGKIEIPKGELKLGIYYISIHNDMSVSTKPVILTE